MQFYESIRLQFLWLLPLMILLFIYSSRRKKNLLAKFGIPETVAKLTVSHSNRKVCVKRIIVMAVLALLVMALARPQWGSEKKKISRKGIDLVFLVDTSLSMLAEDVKPSRIEKAKFEMKSFLKFLKGDRVGIVTFAGSGFLQSPLTLDYSAFSLFADTIEVGFIPDPGTNLSRGIEMSLGAFPEKQSSHRAIVVLSDGEHLEGNVDDVIVFAKKSKTPIYTIGIGTKSGDPIPLRSAKGKIGGYKKDRSGKVVITKLNEGLLKQIANATGGLYFPATPSEKETTLIYRHMQGIGKTQFKERKIAEREDHFQSFLLAAFILIFAGALIGDRSRHGSAHEPEYSAEKAITN